MTKEIKKDGQVIAVVGNAVEQFWNSVIENTKNRINELEAQLEKEDILLKGAKREFERAQREQK